MITEAALFTIHADRQTEFEVVFPQAEAVISQAVGYLSHTMQRGIEADNTYLLLVQWESLDAHTEGFRQSDLFTQWRAIIGPFFAQPPVVHHYRAINFS